jgi:rhodanese-related sulfurtransferase
MGRFAKIFSESVPIIGISELKEKLAQGNRPYLLDVRQAVEYRTGHAASATLIPLGELGSRLNEAPKDREVVCICATGHRSAPATRQLVAAGYAARSLKNGMIAWQLAKLPIKTGILG